MDDSREILRAIADTLPGGALFVLDRQSRYTLAAGEALEEAGIRPEDLEGKSLAEALGPEHASQAEPDYREALAGRRFHREHALLGRQYLTYGGPLCRESGEVYAALAVSYDITDRRRAEEAAGRAWAELERLVADRTAEAGRTNKRLRAEMAAQRRRDASQIRTLRRLLEEEEAGRRQISREVDDWLGGEMAGLMLGLEAMEGLVREGAGGGERLAEMKESVRRVIREAHHLAVEIRPASLDEQGLRPALEALVGVWSRRSGIPADFRCDDSGGGLVPPVAGTAIYRIVQESLADVARHAGATRVAVVLDCRGDRAAAIVEHDGMGFDPYAGGGAGRLGLLGMRERATLAGGTLDVEWGRGGGTTVRVVIPLATRDPGEGG